MFSGVQISPAESLRSIRLEGDEFWGFKSMHLRMPSYSSKEIQFWWGLLRVGVYYIRGKPIRSKRIGRTSDHYDFNGQRKF